MIINSAHCGGFCNFIFWFKHGGKICPFEPIEKLSKCIKLTEQDKIKKKNITVIIITFIDQYSSDSLCAKYFAAFNLFNLYNDRLVNIVIHFFQLRKSIIRELDNLSRITEQGKGSTGVQSHVFNHWPCHAPLRVYIYHQRQGTPLSSKELLRKKSFIQCNLFILQEMVLRLNWEWHFSKVTELR